MKYFLSQQNYSFQGRAEFQIGHIKIVIRDGDITEDDSEAIVASCNMDLDLSKGKKLITVS
jgi:hypothetical protein